MSINIHIEKKDLLLLIAIGILLVGVAYVIAYNEAMSGGTPSVMGHSSDEIMVRNSSGSLVSLQTYISQSNSNVYDSGWFSITTNQIYDKTHNLGSRYLFLEVFFAPNSGGGPDESNIYRLTNIYTDSGQYNGASIRMTSDNQLRIKTGQSYVYKDVQGGIGFLSSGWYRIIAKKD